VSLAVTGRRYGAPVKLDDKALRGIFWLVLGGVIVAVAWIISATNPMVGFFLPGLLTFGYFFALWAWWGAWYGRVDDRRRAILNQEREAMYRATGLDQIDVMTGVEFENYVAAVLRGVGYNVTLTKATGDFGVDLIATKDGVRTAV
jgi:restriction system protein